MPLVGLTVAGCARQTPSSTKAVAPTTASLPATPEECTAQDAAGRTVRFLPTLNVATPPAQGEGACALARDLIALLHEETRSGIANICEVFDKETPESQAQLRSMAARASTPEQLRFAKAVSMCLPENREQTVKSMLPAPAIYSAGTVKVDGHECRAYLFVMEGAGPMQGSTVYRPRLLDECSGDGKTLEDRAFMPEQRPTAPPLGDLLREIGYTGRLPEQFTSKGSTYSFVTAQSATQPSAAESPKSPQDPPYRPNFRECGRGGQLPARKQPNSEVPPRPGSKSAQPRSASGRASASSSQSSQGLSLA